MFGDSIFSGDRLGSKNRTVRWKILSICHVIGLFCDSTAIVELVYKTQLFKIDIECIFLCIVRLKTECITWEQVKAEVDAIKFNTEHATNWSDMSKPATGEAPV
jgi:hypothetical protein